MPQGTTGKREALIWLVADTVTIDSLSLVYGSLNLYDTAGNVIESNLFTVDFAHARIIPGDKLKKSLAQYRVTYQVFPYSFPVTIRHKKFVPGISSGVDRFDLYRYSTEYTDQGLSRKNFDVVKHGTLARGIGFGNNQDVVLNSTLNLQLSGQISDDIEITAAISDENIPIQPDGTTQSVQEFDKVYIQLDHRHFRLVAGDFELTRPQGYFLNLNKKAKGLMGLGFFNNENKSTQITTKGGFSIQKGKYNRMVFNGVEGKQGPYKLRGAQNEMYVMVLAGTERVYIDGVLLQRGANNDYVIDYNLAEISFTPDQPITKDKRITVEFEYSERFYNRFMVFGSAAFTQKNMLNYVHIYSESDARNQPLDQELTDNQKEILSRTGDDLQQAVVSAMRYDTVFSGDYVFYKLADTLLPTGEFFDSILAYSTNRDSAKWRAAFSFVGENKGYYVIDNKAVANGRVYKWVAPENGIPSGNYMPVALLVTPKKKQMAVAGGKMMLGSSTAFTYEAAVSLNDLNTFSSEDDRDNTGLALKTGIEHEGVIDSLKNYALSFHYQLIQKQFTPIEQFREVEFDRDWNRSADENTHQHLLAFSLMLNTPFWKKIMFDTEMLDQSPYRAFRNRFSGLAMNSKNRISWNVSLLNTSKNEIQTRFARAKLACRRSFRFFNSEIFTETEDNRWFKGNTDSILQQASRFFLYGGSLSLPDSTMADAQVSYQHRLDYKPFEGIFILYSYGDLFSIRAARNKNPGHTFSSTLSYRSLHVNDTTGGLSDVRTLLGRVEHGINIFSGIVNLNTYYETGTSLEPKREFTYIQVNPGQGVYVWIDYNHNGVKELNEFETAGFSDTASYIRMMLPGESQVKTYTLVFGEIVNLKTPAPWTNKKGVFSFLSRFTDQFAWRMDRKILNDDFSRILNPFYQASEQELISYSGNLRNTLSFNRTGTVFGSDVTMQLNRSRIMLLNGFDERRQFISGLRVRWNLSQWVTLINDFESGNRKYNSDAFSEKNYEISHLTVNPSLQFILSPELKIKVDYRYQEKINQSGTEQMEMHVAGCETRYSLIKKGNASANVDFVKVGFNGDEFSPIAWEMLGGYRKGNNLNFRFLIIYNITEVLQLSADYNMRKSEGYPPVHTGMVQVRAYF